MDEELTKMTSPCLIEICEMPEDEVAGRVKIKISALEIVPDNTKCNDNGISWLEEYIQANIKSGLGMPYVVNWLIDKEIPSDHGIQSYDENGNIEFTGVSVGSVQDIYVTDIEINGIPKRVLMTEGYLYSQRFPLFIKWLRTELKNNTIYGSIEINGKGKARTIEYLDGSVNEDGTLKKFRVPTVFDFSGLSILYLTEPADKNSQVLELNTKTDTNEALKEGKNDIMKIEINELNHEDISILVENLFNKKFNENSDDYKYFYICKFYPTISTFIMKSWSAVGEYYKSTYTINDAKLVISDIVKVEESWKPVNGENSIEVNSSLFNIINNQNNQTKEVNKEMDEKIVLELNKKIEDKTNEINALNKDIETKATEINSLTTKVTELETKNSEFSATIVEINKSLETEKSEKEKVTVEFNSLKEEKEKKEAETLKVEINTYFDVEIPKNGFEESEVNSLKEYVEKCDFDGLKNAEKELVFKKFKESKVSVETNTSNTTNFIATKKVDESKKTSIPTFFNN